MILLDRLETLFPRAVSAVRARVVMLKKALSFALIGVINTAIDASVFFPAYFYLTSMPSAVRPLEALAGFCQCGSRASLTLVTANVISWIVAVTCSYTMNSFITFAAESGRQLKWRAYGTFVASGVVGVLANTTTLVTAAQFMPVWAAKGCAILVSFLVNFSLSHFVVFRPRRRPAGEPR